MRDNCTTHHNACACREAMYAERIEALRSSLAETAGVLNALNERRTPGPSMSLRRSLVDVARRLCAADPGEEDHGAR